MPTVDTSIKVALGDRSYEIVVGRNLLDDLGRRLLALGYSGKVGAALIKTSVVYLPPGSCALEKSAGLIAHLTIIPAGERTKRLRWVGRVLNDLVERRFEAQLRLDRVGRRRDRGSHRLFGGHLSSRYSLRSVCRPPLSRKWIPASAAKLGSIIQWAKLSRSLLSAASGINGYRDTQDLATARVAWRHGRSD